MSGFYAIGDAVKHPNLKTVEKKNEVWFVVYLYQRNQVTLAIKNNRVLFWIEVSRTVNIGSRS